MTHPPGLNERGRKMWKDSLALRPFGPGEIVVLEEACRLATRLDKLHELLTDGSEEWAHIATSFGEGDADFSLVINSLLIEARQAAGQLRLHVATLGLVSVPKAEDGSDESAPNAGKDGLDDLESQRAKRLSGA